MVTKLAFFTGRHKKTFFKKIRTVHFDNLRQLFRLEIALKILSSVIHFMKTIHGYLLQLNVR